MAGCMLLSQGLREAGTSGNCSWPPPLLSQEEERRGGKMAVSFWMPEGSSRLQGLQSLLLLEIPGQKMSAYTSAISMRLSVICSTHSL